MLYPLADIAPDLEVPGVGTSRRASRARGQSRHRAPVSTPESEDCRRYDRRRLPRAHRRRTCRRSATSWSKGRSASARPASRRRLAGDARSGAGARAGRAESLPRALLSSNPKAGALPAQLFFLFQRAQQLGTLKQQDLFAPRRVADYLFEKDRLFAGLTLDAGRDGAVRAGGLAPRRGSAEARSRGLPAGAGGDAAGSASPSAASATRAGIDAAYLTRLNDAYARFFHEYDRAPLLIVNAASIDPVQNQADYDELVARDPAHEEGAHVLQPAAPRYYLTRARGLTCTRISNNAIRRGRRCRWARSTR